MKFKKYMQMFTMLCLLVTAPERGMQSAPISDVSHEVHDEQSGDWANVTQSLKHLICNPKSLAIAQRFIEKDERKRMFNDAVAKEKELHQDYYTFVHGQRAEYYFPEKLYTLLWQQRKKSRVNDFIFLHMVPLVESEQEQMLEASERERLLAHGRSSWFDFNGRKKLLFMNYALFANSGLRGSSSSYFIAKNHNYLAPTLQVGDVFSMLNYESIYQIHKDEIEELAKLYREKSIYGNLMLIAIPKATIADYAYLAAPGGAKREIYVEGIGYTSDLQIIMETLRNDPEKIENTDSLEFCLIMAQNRGGLDPATGIKVIPILSGDLVNLASLQAKEDALCAKIAKSIEIKDRKEAAIRRANILANHLNSPVNEPESFGAKYRNRQTFSDCGAFKAQNYVGLYQ